jgi:DNA-binding FadR family transcriptional regulator
VRVATGEHVSAVPVLAGAVRIACHTMTAWQLQGLRASADEAWRTPAALGWDRKARAHVEIFRLLATGPDDPLAPALSSGAEMVYGLLIDVGRVADGMVTGSRQRLLAYLQAGDADAAEQETESHLRVLHYLARLATSATTTP